MEYVSPGKFLNDLSGISLIDVRSPGEFEDGHIPGAINISIFTDEERAEVGVLYKNIGKMEAVKKGLSFVGPKMEEMANMALKHAVDNSLRIYCWRGGMRSEKMAWLFELVGLKIYILEGGYKAFRNHILDSFSAVQKLIVLHGPTGTGKTDILKVLQIRGEQVIDLEDLAHHRGSAFGAIGMNEQPSTQQFQNDLHLELNKHDLRKPIWVEGESMSIGRVFLPEIFWDLMNEAFIVKLEMKKELRARRLVNDYGSFDVELLAESVKKIRKKFGEDNVIDCLDMLDKKDLYGVALRLLDYYDKTYAFSLKKYKTHAPLVISCKSIDPEINAGTILTEVQNTSLDV